jgi:hypothetical protein
MKRLLLIAAIAFTAVSTYSNEPTTGAVAVSHSALEGIGAEPGVRAVRNATYFKGLKLTYPVSQVSP